MLATYKRRSRAAFFETTSTASQRWPSCFRYSSTLAPVNGAVSGAPVSLPPTPLTMAAGEFVGVRVAARDVMVSFCPPLRWGVGVVALCASLVLAMPLEAADRQDVALDAPTRGHVEE